MHGVLFINTELSDRSATRINYIFLGKDSDVFANFVQSIRIVY